MLAIPADAQSLPNAQKRTTYVGQIQNTEAQVSVHVSDTDAQGNREVVLYACDGKPQGIAIWFKGTTSSNTFTATSSTGEQLSLTIARKQVLGTVSFPDGTANAVTANKDSGGGGLYNITLFPNGRFSGDAFRGTARVSGQVTVANGEATAEARITFNNGLFLNLRGRLLTSPVAGDYRVIFGPGWRLVGTTYPPFTPQDQLVGDNEFVYGEMVEY
jgi:hypothetical protein